MHGKLLDQILTCSGLNISQISTIWMLNRLKFKMKDVV